MKLDPSHHKLVKWTARISALAILLFGLPFYFGYGNPLPFINPEYTLWDNAWLCIFPLIFLGLALGWRYQKIGGYLIVIPVCSGLLLGLALEAELILHMLFPLVPGILYLVAGYGNKARQKVLP